MTIYGDEEQTRPLFSIKADRVLDISARYHISDAQGLAIGTVQRHGMRSFWQAHYEIRGPETPPLTIREENAWVKVIDGLLGEIPVVGLFTGFIFNPAYRIAREDGTPVLRLEKQRSLFESTFRLEQQAPLEPEEEQLVLLSVLMMILLERSRG